MIDIINIGVNYIIEMVAAWQYFRSFYSSKCSKQTECMFMVSAYVMMFCLFWLQIFWFNAVDFLIINCFLCFYLFSRRMSSSVFHALILTVAMVVTEVIIELVCMRLLDGFLVFTQNSISYAIVSIGSRIFYFFVIRIIIVVLHRRKRDWKPKAALQFY